MSTAETSTVLVVDDDPGVRQSLVRALRLDGYEVLEARDGVEGLESAPSADMMVLDVTMPNLGGFEVCRRLREARSDLPVLVLTARHSTADRVEGLDAGADDYLVKPFALEELLARVRALLRRRQPEAGLEADADVMTFADISLNHLSRQVNRGSVDIELTRTEFTLLKLFLRHPNQVLTRDQIYEAVWGYDSSMASNSLEVYIGYLRRKTEVDGGSRVIHTVRGIGYVLRES
ncbi:MAG: response regulator transcription factor [Actinomycetota bacterium]|jgi:two-component system, OmpR family, response regulator MprA|nr:response regulator transcription factor [Actinomycetota bacterium]